MKDKKASFIIHAIQVLKDNIIWIWQEGNMVVVVDPATSKPIKQWIEANNLTLYAILQTHHHDDHIGGTQDLLKRWPSSSVIASKEDLHRIPFQTHSVSDKEKFFLFGYPIKVIKNKR